jgi:hypothetical protein
MYRALEGHRLLKEANIRKQRAVEVGKGQQKVGEGIRRRHRVVEGDKGM